MTVKNGQNNLLSQIEDKIFEVANLHEKVTTSDLQGVATVKAMEIIALVNNQRDANTAIKNFVGAVAAVKSASSPQALNAVNDEVETLHACGQLKLSDQEWVFYTDAIRNRAYEVALRKNGTPVDVVPLTPMQKAVVEHYEGGEFSHIQSVSEAREVGDTLFVFALIEVGEVAGNDADDAAKQESCRALLRASEQMSELANKVQH